ncbi:glycosyltransferase [Nocardioides flavescens]|uniref:Glycosyl transferase n=1 Tax=Nocardioides flavescens TaxID=2691959 RepID=A0A6L7F3H5_9ACTN|nr:glycosyltransferase [Nocardioides flavescens]MXG91780.1 glycosyl transferase [Nocardioides flavescens]
MIGYYVHHHGHGHRHRALEVARVLTERGETVTGLSSLPAPDGWPGPWVQLAPDAETGDREPLAPTAGGRLHWVPLGHAGLRSRSATVSAWIDGTAPSAVVVDVSVEMALLVRLHGVPVVTLVQPGERGDAAHRLGYDVADALVGCWPPEAGGTGAGMLRGLAPAVVARVQPVGALSRFPVRETSGRAPGRRVVLLSGSGGSALDATGLAAARAETPGWEWTVLDARLGAWVDDPRAALCDADVVITHAGQNALAEVAASRTPAVVVAQDRPHREQEVTADVLARGPWPAVVADAWPGRDWARLLERAAALDGAGWTGWCDGRAAERFADLVLGAALEAGR